MAAWLGAVMPTRRPAAKAATIMRAPRKVLPVPGGPWTGRTERSSPRVADDERIDILAQPARHEPRRLTPQDRSRRRKSSVADEQRLGELDQSLAEDAHVDR